MVDLNATDGSVRKKPYRSPVPESAGGGKPMPAKTRDDLDGEEMVVRQKKLLGTYTAELDRQRDNRAQMATDEQFYDNEQWTEEDAKTLRDRGQMPLVYNVISASVDWVTGTQRRGRTDHKVLPRRKEGSKPAERKSQLMKYLSDVNRAPFEWSRAFEDSVKAGLGWIEDAIDDDIDGEPITRRYESWRNLLFDSLSQRLDFLDGRYIFRAKWVDLDIAEAIFPNRKEALQVSAAEADRYSHAGIYGDDVMDEQEVEHFEHAYRMSTDYEGYSRERVRIIEGWYRSPIEAERIKGGEFSGEIYDPQSPGHEQALSSGEAEIDKRVMMRMHCGLFTPSHMLWHGPSPYRHNRFPFTPVWGYRRSRDGMPYGMIRRLRDIQEDVNKRASKALYIISSNKIIADEGAIPENMTREEFLEEASRPDAFIEKRRGTEIKLDADRELAPAHLDLMSRSISLIQSASGVTDENLGRRTNASSGIAIQRRQDQGALATMKFFDNLLLAHQISGEKQLSLMEQFMSEQKQFRITNGRGTPEFITINDDLPENDIVRTKADFIISEQDWQATMRQAAAVELLEIMGRQPPAVALTMLDLVIENMDLKNREEIVKRIRQVTGQRDPDAEEITPEEQAAMEAQAADQQLQRSAIEADIVKKLSEASRATSQARQIAAKIAGDNVDAQDRAIDAAIKALQMPAAAEAADLIMHESGFTARSEQERSEQRALAAQQPPGHHHPPQPASPMENADAPHR
jgi:hypothetical protein